MKNLRKEKLYKQVFYQIRDYIIDNDYKQGQKLPTEAEMCEMLGVSRNVLREAVKTLEFIGVVESKPGVGIVVQELSMEFLYQNMFYGLIVNDKKLIDEILDIRKILEMSYARAAFKTITAQDIQKLKDIIANDENVPFEDQDKEFHMYIYKGLDNKTLNSIMESAWNVDRGINGVTGYDYSHDRLLEIHSGIIEALEAGNVDKFVEALEYHFSSGIYVERNKFKQ